jgi:AraC-like DNA-binding protein
MDFHNWAIPKKLSFSPAGKYLVELPPDFPIRLYYYDFSLPHATIPNYHDFLEIVYILDGSGTFTIGQRQYPAGPRDIFVINSGVFHLLESEREQLDLITIYFMPELVYQPATSAMNLEYLLLFLNYSQAFSPKIGATPEQSAEILVHIEAIARELGSEGAFYRIAVKNHLCEILLALNRASGLSGADGGELHMRLRDIKRLKPVFEFIREHFSQKITLASLAKASGMSVTHLCRYFKKVTGKTLTDYVKRYRVDKAKELLIEDERSITWIAYEVGFESHSYFDRIFHQITRLTPQEFRRKYMPKVSVDGS